MGTLENPAQAMGPSFKTLLTSSAPNVTVSLGMDTRSETYLVDKAPFMKILREISVFLNVKNKHVSPEKLACF